MASIESTTNGRRLFVSNLSPYTSKRKLLGMLTPYNATNLVILRRYPDSNQAFVTFKTKEDATSVLALSREEGFVCDFKRLKMFMARPKKWREGNGEEGCNFSVELPPDCIAKIARYLPYADRARLEMVSSLWREGSLLSHRVVRHLEFEDWRWPERKYITTSFFDWMVRRQGETLITIAINDERLLENVKPRIVSAIGWNCSQLAEVDLTGLRIWPSSLRTFKFLSSQLKSLSLGTTEGPVDAELGKIFDKAIELRYFRADGTNIYGKCLTHLHPNLETLILRNCSHLESRLASITLSNMKRLRHLEIIYCANLRDNTILRTLIDTNANLFRTLSLMKFHHCSFIEPENDIAQVLVNRLREKSIPKLYRELNRLSVAYCIWVNYNFVIDIGRYMRNLSYLNLSGCKSIRDEYLEPLASLSQLQILEINCMHPSVSFFFLQSLESLTELHCRKNVAITDEDICGVLNNCSQIAIIDMEGCYQVGVATLKRAARIAKSRKKLIHMYVAGTKIKESTAYEETEYLQLTYKYKYF
ncbi:F-box/LRR-repeat protein 7-like [Apis laboriosa]|uniref:F-box/LRR-repeat protein 7-like n=1 Tax=Apis laboriosa TaxID=183418 RepID=UPI001CC572AE|nr:F-box/LRR-repeat protein 7-like [Apis laboriosa]